MPKPTHAVLVSNIPVTFALPSKAGAYEVYNTCPEWVYIAAGESVSIPAPGKPGGYPIGPGERVMITFDKPKASAIVHSLGGFLYITQV